MNILLVYPKPDEYKKPRYGFSYELLTIATVLQNYHHVILRDYSCEIYDAQWLMTKVYSKEIDLIILECDSFALKRSQNIIHAKEIIDLVKNHVPIIAFGNYCCITRSNFYLADYTIQSNDINLLIKLVNSISNAQKIPLVLGFDSLPHIDRNILLSIDYYKHHRHSTLLQTSKGCENTCIFCQRKGWNDHYIAHSNSYVLDELKVLRRQGYKNTWIIDENFSFNLPRAKSLLQEMYANSLTSSMNFFISSWVNIDTEFLDLAARCNVRIISFGIESGSQEILNFYRKNINLEHIPDIIHYADSIGIFTVGNFILGAPMETEDTIQKTFSLIQECGFDQVNIKTLDYMIGSDLYKSLSPSLLKTGHVDHLFACAENNLTRFSLRDLVERKNDFQQRYYKQHKKKIKAKIERFGLPYLE